MTDEHDKTQSVSVASPMTTLEAPAAVQRRSLPRPKLLRVHGGKSGRSKSWTLAPGSTLIGRAVSESGVLLSDERSSRIHASLHVEDGAVRIEDHSKKNGCFLFGERVEHSALVPDGGVLRLGDTLFVLRWTRAEDESDADVPSLAGGSLAMKAVRRQIALVARSLVTALLRGETGTGKEVSARALHEVSGRSGAFVAVNCAALPEALVESQLFGHKKGAFTGADASRDGFFQEAHDGTLFLDELGELPLSVQAKLLRVLDDGIVTRVGETQGRAVSVRVVAATNRDVAGEAARGAFRADLYARIAGITLELPALRERREDVIPLLRGFLDDDKPLEADLVERLLCHSWPYNVRELKKVAEELSLRGGERARYSLDLVERRLAPAAGSHASDDDRVAPLSGATMSAAPAKQAPPTREQLVELLASCDGNVVEVARLTGRSRKQVYRWLEKHGVDPEAFRGAAEK